MVTLVASAWVTTSSKNELIKSSTLSTAESLCDISTAQSKSSAVGRRCLLLLLLLLLHELLTADTEPSRSDCACQREENRERRWLRKAA